MGKNIENPGPLNAFVEGGGTQQEWDEQLDAFHRQQEGLGFSDAELLAHAGVTTEAITADE
ncbi:MAG: hypothetical protein U5L95_01830 [Candidatus Saccharibacteria bacterium]|nr:hypothetical protein [Candidatus Saccharibacteria bacterium]